MNKIIAICEAMEGRERNKREEKGAAFRFFWDGSFHEMRSLNKRADHHVQLLDHQEMSLINTELFYKMCIYLEM